MVVRADAALGAVQVQAGPAGVLAERLNPGDTLFVPEKFDKRSAYARFIEGAKDLTAIFYQFGLGAAGLKVLKD